MMRSVRIPPFAFVATLAIGACAAWSAGCDGEEELAPVDGGALDATAPPNGDGASVPDEAGDADAIDASNQADASDGSDAAAVTDAADASDASDAASAADAFADASPTDAAPDASVPPTIDVYDPSEVKTYELTFDAAALAILSSTAPADEKTWVHGTFKYGNVTLADVGVRRKGSSTFRALPKKAALKVKFDKYVDGQKFAGLKELTLNNSLSDPTFIAERLTYHVFRSIGLPAQRAVSARIEINGASYGVYTNVETPNKDFIKRVFGAQSKTLYEVNWGSDWQPGSEDGFEEEVGDGSLSDVAALFAAVNVAKTATLLADVSAHLDTTQYLRFVAAEAAVGHYDGYAFGNWSSHNYFMAGNASGVFSLIPWSTDLSMSNRLVVVDANTPKGAGSFALRCKASSSCWADYKTQMKSVLAAYETLALPALAQTWHAQVDALVKADPKREDHIDYYTQSTTQLYTWLAQRPGVIRAQLSIAP